MSEWVDVDEEYEIMKNEVDWMCGVKNNEEVIVNALLLNDETGQTTGRLKPTPVFVPVKMLHLQDVRHLLTLRLLTFVD